MTDAPFISSSAVISELHKVFDNFLSTSEQVVQRGSNVDLVNRGRFWKERGQQKRRRASACEMMMQQHPHQHHAPDDGGGHGALEPLGHCEDHHVVVGRLDMAPVGGLRMLDDAGEQRILYGEKPLGDDNQTLGNGHAQYHGHGVDMGNDKHGHGVEDMDGKLGVISAAMLGVEQKMEPPERQMSEGDVGTANSPQVGKLRGRGSRDPAIEWSESATTVLLQAFGEKYRALDCGNFTSKIWADIAARVNNRGSLTVLLKRKTRDRWEILTGWGGICKSGMQSSNSQVQSGEEEIQEVLKATFKHKNCRQCWKKNNILTRNTVQERNSKRNQGRIFDKLSDR